MQLNEPEVKALASILSHVKLDGLVLGPEERELAGRIAYLAYVLEFPKETVDRLLYMACSE